MIPRYRAYIVAEKLRLPVIEIYFDRQKVVCKKPLVESPACPQFGLEDKPMYGFDEIVFEEWVGKYELEDVDLYVNDLVKFKIKKSVSEQGWKVGTIKRVGAKYIIWCEWRHYDITNNIIELLGQEKDVL